MKENSTHKDKQTSIQRIFVVGCGHSGTSLMIRLLGEHSRIFAIPNETGIFLSGQDELIKKHLNEFDQMALRQNKTIWVEKTPKHVKCIDKMLELCPDSKIIVMVRDPPDVACSLKARGFTFKEGILRWIEDNDAIIGQIRKGRRIFIVRLENLIQSPENEIRSVLRFLSLPYENLLDFHHNKKNWYANSIVDEKPEDALGKNHEFFRNWQINQPLFNTTKRCQVDMDNSDKEVYDR